MSLRTPAQAMAWMREHRLTTLSGPEPPPSLVVAVVGEPVRGSWWSHRLGGTIYALASALDDAPDVLSTKLVDGRVTFVHEALWPAVARVVTDATWRRARRSRLSDAARALLGTVERRGQVRLDEMKIEKKTLARAKTELERHAVVMSTQMHTESGKHATVLRSWNDWVSAAVAKKASKLAMLEAQAILAERGCTV